MILPDTSAWIEYLRSSGSPVDGYLTTLIGTHAPLATNEIVMMEVLAGARDDVHLQKLRRLLRHCQLFPLRGLDDYETAARLYRECGRRGETIRKLADCLVAVSAITAGVPVLHLDRDFDILARHSGLQIAQPPGT